jgi:hypothetical protein
VQIAVGLGALTASIPIIAMWFMGWDVTYSAMLTRMVNAFSMGSR